MNAQADLKLRWTDMPEGMFSDVATQMNMIVFKMNKIRIAKTSENVGTTEIKANLWLLYICVGKGGWCCKDSG